VSKTWLDKPLWPYEASGPPVPHQDPPQMVSLDQRGINEHHNSGVGDSQLLNGRAVVPLREFPYDDVWRGCAVGRTFR